MISPNDYDYFLSPELIANQPAVPRDACKLMVYDTKNDKVFFDRFSNLAKHLPKNSFLILNDTKVLPSRAVLFKESGGKVKVLFLVNEILDKGIVPVMVDRKIVVGEKIYFDENYFLTIEGQRRKIFFLRFEFSRDELFGLLKKYGTMPVPLYIKNSPLSEKELRERYQTIFAKNEGSSAAPTASLHFTEKVFEEIEKKGINKYFVTLNVGLGTFSPIDEKNVIEKKLHEEFWEISERVAEEIKKEKGKGKKLIAVGTTVVRTLESWTLTGMIPVRSNSRIELTGMIPVNKTELFIYPPYEFKTVDGLVTNFHLPKSSLIMLVDAFLRFKGAKRNVLELYKLAVEEKMRFYSFGDAMLIL